MKFLPFHRVSLLTQRLRDLTTYGDWYAKRLAIAMGMGLMGLRSGSVVQVRRIHLSRAGCTLHVPPRKRGLPRDLPIPPNLATALWSFLATHESPNVICTTTGRPLCRRTLQRAAVNVIDQTVGPGFRFHSLRHTYAIKLYSETKDILLVQKALGHRDLRSTLVYARTLATIQDAAVIDWPANPSRITHALTESLSSTKGTRQKDEPKLSSPPDPEPAEPEPDQVPGAQKTDGTRRKGRDLAPCPGPLMIVHDEPTMGPAWASQHDLVCKGCARARRVHVRSPHAVISIQCSHCHRVAVIQRDIEESRTGKQLALF